jgi:hypothetical protein
MVEKGNPLGNKTFASLPSPQEGRNLFACLLPDMSRLRPPVLPSVTCLRRYRRTLLLSPTVLGVPELPGVQGRFAGDPCAPRLRCLFFVFYFPALRRRSFWVLAGYSRRLRRTRRARAQPASISLRYSLFIIIYSTTSHLRG